MLSSGVTINGLNYFIALTKMMVVGGFASSILRWNEITDLTAATQCNLRKPFPEPIREGIGVYLNGDAIVCGGARTEYYNTCKKYVASGNAWEDIPGTMTAKRRMLGGIKLDETRFWMTGGINAGGKEGQLKSTEIYDSATGQFTPSVDLPIHMKYHTLFWYDSETILSFFPQESARRYYLFNTKTQKFTPKYINKGGLTTSTSRDEIWGGLTTSGGVKKYILAHVTKGQMFSITLPDHKWTEIAMPDDYKIIDPTIVPYENSFYVVGGNVDGADSGKIYWFDPDAQQLVLQPQEFTKPRKFPIAFLLPPDFNRCPKAA